MKFDLVGFLKGTLPALRQLAALTTTTLDDTAVAFAELALQNQFVADFLMSLVRGNTLPADAHTLAAACPEAHQAALAAGFDWNRLVAALPGLINLIKMLAVFGK